MSDYDAAFAAAAGGGGSEENPYDKIAKDALSSLPRPVQPKESAQPVNDFSGNLRFATPFGTLDTRIPLPQFVNRGLAQFGSGVADYGAAFDAPAQVDAKRAIDRPLLDMPGGSTLNFAGKVGPAMAVPNIGGPVLGGMIAGGVMGAMEPVGTGESRGFNTATSAVLGGAIPGAVKGFQALARPDAAKADLARSALRDGIPVGVSDITDSKFLKATRSVLNDVPFIGGIGERQAAKTQEGFNKAVAKVVGENADSLTPQVMANAKTRIGGELNRIWENNSLKLDARYVADVQQILQDATAKLNPEQAQSVIKQVRNLMQKQANGEIPGSFTNNWQSELRMLADGEKGLAKKYLNDLRQTTIQAFNRSVTGADASALSKARMQYGAYKTLEPIMNKAEAGVGGRVTGDVPAALLPGRVVEQYGSAGRSPFGDLPQIGSQFLVDRVPRTGGSARAAIQNTLVGSGLMSGGAAAGAAVASGLGAGVGLAGGLGLTAILEKALGSPAIARSVLANPQVQRGLLDNPEFSKAMLEIMRNSASRLPAATGMGLLSAPALE